MTRPVNATGRRLIKDGEGLRLRAYPDPGSGGDPWTIGYGHTGPEVRKGQSITMAEAERLLDEDIAEHGAHVVRLAGPMTDNQYAALLSFTFNLGPKNLEKSTLLKKHRAGDFRGAASEFGKWNKASGRVLPGLTKRRALEAALYLKP